MIIIIAINIVMIVIIGTYMISGVLMTVIHLELIGLNILFINKLVNMFNIEFVDFIINLIYNSTTAIIIFIIEELIINYNYFIFIIDKDHHFVNFIFK